MSLKAFHVFFIVASIVLGFFFGFWCLQQWRFLEAPSYYVVVAGLSFLSGLFLMFYLRGVLRKLKNVSFL